jgi:aminopeptidase N
VLAETMAHYGALMIGEKRYGREPIHRFRELLLHNYLVVRQNRRTEEVPLLRSNDQEYIHYDKGALVMYALREAIGEERLNEALRRLFARHAFGGPPYPTTRDMLREIEAVTPAQLRGLLQDLVEEITLWNLRARDGHVQSDLAGGYRVTFTVEAAKLKADATGRDKAVPMSHLIEVGVFADADLREPLYLQKQWIRSGTQTITVTVPRQPARAAIDPYNNFIERDALERARTNNVVELTR